MFKKFTALALTAVLLALTGCTEAEMRFTEVLQNMNNVAYYETEGVMEFEMSYDGTDQYFTERARTMSHIFDGASITINGATEQNPATGASKAYYHYDWTVDPVSVIFEGWEELDLTNETFMTILAIPDLVKAMLPEDYAKDYAYFDHIEMLEHNSVPVSIEGLASVIQESEQDLAGFMERYGFTDALDGNVSVATSTSGGRETLKLTISDAQLKSFILDYLEAAKTDSEIQSEFYILYSTVVTGGLDPRLITPELIEMLVPDIETKIEDVVGGVEDFLDETTLLGRDGITYEIVIGRDGNIESSELIINVLINADLFPYVNHAAAYGYKSDQKMLEADGRVEFTLTYSNVYSNYNTNMHVTPPTLTRANSVDVTEESKGEE